MLQLNKKDDLKKKHRQNPQVFHFFWCGHGFGIAFYQAQLDAAGGQIMFVPFIVDEYGSIGDHGQQLLMHLAF